MMTTSSHLPIDATDDGERIVLAPAPGTRAWLTAGGLFGLTVGVALLLAAGGAMMALGGIAAALGGLYLVLAQAQRLQFDAEAARRRSLLRPATVAWSEVTGATVSDRRERQGLQRDRPVVVSLQHQTTGPDLTIELDRSDLEQGRALLTTLHDRGWLPQDVGVTVEDGR